MKNKALDRLDSFAGFLLVIAIVILVVGLFVVMAAPYSVWSVIVFALGATLLVPGLIAYAISLHSQAVVHAVSSGRTDRGVAGRSS